MTTDTDPRESEWAQRLAAAEREVRDLRGAMNADDERLRAASERVFGDFAFGCDTAMWLADEVMGLRQKLDAECAVREKAEARCAELEKERDEARDRLNVRGLSCTPDLDLMRLTAERDEALAAAAIRAEEHRKERDRRVAAEAEVARLREAGIEFASQYEAHAIACRFDNSCDDSGREPACVPCAFRRALAPKEERT